MKPEAKITQTTSSTRGKRYTVFVVTYYDDNDKRRRKVFTDEAKAARFKKDCDHDRAIQNERRATLRNRIGEDAMKLPTLQLRQAADAVTILEGKISLSDAARFARQVVDLQEQYDSGDDHASTLDGVVSWYENALKHAQKEMQTVSQYVQVYLAASEGALRVASIYELNVRLKRFCDAFGERRLDEVERTEISEWLDAMRTKQGEPLSVNSKKHYRYAVAGLFAHAIEHTNLVSENPAVRQTKSRRTQHLEKVRYKVEIFTPDQARALITAARKHFPSMVAPVALGLFAGLRTNEIMRLTWEEHISLNKGIVMITDKVAKTGQIRNVEITSTLHEWLAACPSQAGKVAPEGAKWTYRRRKLLEKAGLEEWPRNGMRHSYGSYHLAQFGDAKNTISNLGHGSDVFLNIIVN